MRDIWQGNRTKFVTCTYWSGIKDDKIARYNEIVYEKQPSGYFKAKILSNYTEENQTFENAFMLKKVTVVLEVTDVVKDLERNDIVEMKGELYRVTDIERKPIAKQEQFLKDAVSYTTYISLRR